MQTYLVGGAVRDRLLDLPVLERDWVVVGATAAELIALGYQQVGKDFPVFLHPQSKEEYALARTERKVSQGHTGFTVHAAPEVTLEEDLIRRDLTINAIAEDADGNLIDPYGGLKDIQQRRLQHISAAFAEDPLRVLRVARFTTKLNPLGFSISPSTSALMCSIAESGELGLLSRERVWQETRKALSCPQAQIYFQVLLEHKALNQLAPELALGLEKQCTALTQLAQLPNADIRFSASVLLACREEQGFNFERCETILSYFATPKALQQETLLMAKYWIACEHFFSHSSAENLKMLSALDVFRRSARCQHILDSMRLIAAMLAAPESVDVMQQRLHDISKIAHDISLVRLPKAEQERLHGKEIGDALEKARCHALEQGMNKAKEGQAL